MRRGISRLAMIVTLLGLFSPGAGAAPEDPPPGNPPGTPPSSTPRSGERSQGSFVASEGTTMPVHGKAKLFRGARGSSKLAVSVGGLQADTVYPVHLHEGSCSDEGDVYTHDPKGPEEPPNQLWASSDPADPKAGVRSDPSGHAKGTGTASWIPRDDARSVTIHSAADQTAVACADLTTG